MTASAQGSLRPRKKPVQARSEATVLAIFEASIQVLLLVGYSKLTTSCVAERAGVSVGTLYQYFPNRQALIRAVLERYLAEMSASIETECRALQGRSLDETAAGLVDAFIAAKWKRLEVSRAMHEPLVEVGGAELVRASAAKGAVLVAHVLRSCPEIGRDDLEPLAVFLVMACTSMLQAAFMDTVVDKETIRTHMHAMARGYLREMRAPASDSRILEKPRLRAPDLSGRDGS
ncbi:MAG: TetR/AcrR family transcriptional regulator [Hyphomicrobiales bacterium]|nr:TetR/AcrR family transcriptional regulator [Hyphomicrobiales bacterium]